MADHTGGNITIQVSAPLHSGKTSLIALLAKHLSDLGADVSVQRADPELQEKLSANEEELQERLKTVSIFIMEMQTGNVRK